MTKQINVYAVPKNYLLMEVIKELESNLLYVIPNREANQSLEIYMDLLQIDYMGK